MFAEIGSTPYRIFFLLHILAAIVAFGAAFVNPLVYRSASRAGAGAPVAQGQAAAGLRISLPALLLTGFFGFALSGMSSQVFKMSQMWLTLSILLWIAQAALYFWGILPAMRRVGDGDSAAEGSMSGLIGVSHLLLLIILYLMIWKPGL